MKIPIHEFKSHLSHYIGKAQSGELLELTSHRKVVAKVTGVPKADDTLAGFVASGAASWVGGKPSGASLSLQNQGKTLSNIVMEDRG